MFCTSIITVYLGLQSISAYGLVGIAVTRYISIRDPLLFNTRVTHGRALTAAIALWIILLVTSALLYFRLSPDGQPNFSLFSTRVMALGGGQTPPMKPLMPINSVSVVQKPGNACPVSQSIARQWLQREFFSLPRRSKIRPTGPTAG